MSKKFCEVALLSVVLLLVGIAFSQLSVSDSDEPFKLQLSSNNKAAAAQHSHAVYLVPVLHREQTLSPTAPTPDATFTAEPAPDYTPQPTPAISSTPAPTSDATFTAEPAPGYTPQPTPAISSTPAPTSNATFTPEPP